MKTAIYARYSTDKQDARSIDDQERRCRAQAEIKGLQVTEVYSDLAISGGHLRRDGLQRMLADSRAKKFKAVIVDDLYRLSRDHVDSGILLRDLKDLRVTVFDVETGISTKDDAASLVFGIKGLIGDEYIKAISRQTHRGLEGRAIAGFNPGGKAYGYTSIEEPNPTDPTRPRRLTVIEPREAEIVRRIFALALEGKSPRDIANGLNEDGVAAPHDGGKGHKGIKGWGHTTIRAMLRSRRYLGELIWNASKWSKTALGTRQPEKREAKDWVRQQRPELAIIDQETFDKINARFVTRAPSGPAKPRAVRPRHVLSGLLMCGVCGGTFGTVYTRKSPDGGVYRALGCIARKDRGESVCSNNHTISDRKVIAALTAHLRKNIAAPDKLNRFVDAYRARFAETEARGEDPRAELLTKVERARQTIQNVTDALLTAPGSKALGDRLQAEERALTALEAQLEALRPRKSKVLPHPAAVATYVTRLAEVLEAGDLVRTGDILRSALAPFKMSPSPNGYRLSGAINLSADLSCSGGVLPGYSADWTPLELYAA